MGKESFPEGDICKEIPSKVAQLSWVQLAPGDMAYAGVLLGRRWVCKGLGKIWLTIENEKEDQNTEYRWIALELTLYCDPLLCFPVNNYTKFYLAQAFSLPQSCLTLSLPLTPKLVTISHP